MNTPLPPQWPASPGLVEIWWSIGEEGLPGQSMPGCGFWTRKLKDHAFKVHLSTFFRLPVKVTGVDSVLLSQLDEELEMVGRLVCGPSYRVNDLLRVVNSRVRFPRHCTIPLECTLAMREVDIAMGWELVVFPRLILATTRHVCSVGGCC